jgi:hypothetical protein
MQSRVWGVAPTDPHPCSVGGNSPHQLKNQSLWKLQENFKEN